MYAYIKGILKSKSPHRVIIENSGIGYEVNITALTYNSLPDNLEEVMLYTYHYIREDKEELYGFSAMGEKNLFEILIGVSSIGPNKAISILSQISPEHFISAVRKNDVITIASIKGIGKKTAEKMILYLKDKISEISIVSEDYLIDRKKIEDALSGLISLGFKGNVAREMLHSIRNEIDGSDKAEDLIKKALKRNV